NMVRVAHGAPARLQAPLRLESGLSRIAAPVATPVIGQRPLCERSQCMACSSLPPTHEEAQMPRFEDSIDVDVPTRVAYDQWTQFEEFPRFMDGAKQVLQIDDRTLESTATVAGQKKVWTAEITDQTPDTRVAWKSTSGAENAGAVLF